MPDIPRILVDIERNQKEHPLSINAHDLLMKGIITVEDYVNIYAGERFSVSIKGIPEPNPGDCVRTSSVTISDQIKQKIQTALGVWIPHQIDHVIIHTSCYEGAKTASREQVFNLRLEILDIKKETKYEIAMDMLFDLYYFTGDSIQDKNAWLAIDHQLESQFQSLALKLIHCTHTDSFDTIS